MAEITITNQKLVDIWEGLSRLGKQKRLDGLPIGNEKFKWGVARNKKLLENDRILLSDRAVKLDAPQQQELLKATLGVRIHRIEMDDVPPEVSPEDRFFFWEFWEMHEPTA